MLSNKNFGTGDRDDHYLTNLSARLLLPKIVIATPYYTWREVERPTRGLDLFLETTSPFTPESIELIVAAVQQVDYITVNRGVIASRPIAEGYATTTRCCVRYYTVGGGLAGVRCI